CALERAAAEEVMHERADVEADLGPERLVVGLEHHPLERLAEALLDEQRCAPDRHVLPLARPPGGSVEGPPPPDHVAVDRKRPQEVESERIELTVLQVRDLQRQRDTYELAVIGAGRRLPDATVGVDARVHTGDRAARPDCARSSLVQRIWDVDAR